MPPHVDDRWSSYLGPGALSSFLLACLTAVLGLGIPVFLRLRQVLARTGEDERGAADAILVFGRVLVDDAPSAVFGARLEHGKALWDQGLAPRIIVTGGLTGRATRTEAEAGRERLLSLGMAEEVVLAEGRSRHTLENLFNVRETMREHGWSRLLLVSDPLHMARILDLARGLSLDVHPSPAAAAPPPPGTLGWYWRALREAFFLHWYHVGMAYSRAIRSERLLSRVT